MWPGPRKPYFGTFVAERVAAYRRLGATVRVVANDDPRTGAGRNLVKYGGLTLRAVRAARRERPDVVEGHYLVPTAIVARLAARVAGCPYVLYAHGSDADGGGGRLGAAVAAAVRHAAEMHTNAPDTRRRLAAAFGELTVAVLPVGVDLTRFTPGGPGRDPIVLFVGNLALHKGPDVLLAALGRLGDLPWRCRMVGEGPLRPALEEAASKAGIAGRLEWVGPVPPEALPELYRTARVLALPSRRDAFGQAAVEALASGTPVVVGDVGGLAQVPDAACGTVVPPGDAEALAAALRPRLAAPLPAATVAAARARAEAFSADGFAATALERLRSVAAGA